MNVNNDDDLLLRSSSSRVPSRAITEVNSLRSLPPPATTATELNNSAAASPALPRSRRLIPSAIATRLGTASVPLASASAPLTPARRYLERGSLQERGTSYLDRSGGVGSNSISERLAEERGQQQLQHPQYGQAGGGGGSSGLLSRAGSLGRRARESGIPSLRS
jgi:hypothetical protein